MSVVAIYYDEYGHRTGTAEETAADFTDVKKKKKSLTSHRVTGAFRKPATGRQDAWTASEPSAGDKLGAFGGTENRLKFQAVSRNNGCRLVPALPGQPDLKSFRSTSEKWTQRLVTVQRPRGDLI